VASAWNDALVSVEAIASADGRDRPLRRFHRRREQARHLPARGIALRRVGRGGNMRARLTRAFLRASGLPSLGPVVPGPGERASFDEVLAVAEPTTDISPHAAPLARRNAASSSTARNATTSSRSSRYVSRAIRPRSATNRPSLWRAIRCGRSISRRSVAETDSGRRETARWVFPGMRSIHAGTTSRTTRAPSERDGSETGGSTSCRARPCSPQCFAQADLAAGEAPETKAPRTRGFVSDRVRPAVGWISRRPGRFQASP
jgi:hypothetical protein